MSEIIEFEKRVLNIQIRICIISIFKSLDPPQHFKQTTYIASDFKIGENSESFNVNFWLIKMKTFSDYFFLSGNSLLVDSIHYYLVEFVFYLYQF